jgi:Kef-type K+ transport system membrane component KefB
MRYEFTVSNEGDAVRGAPKDLRADETEESAEERMNRELDELLQQLRITLPGVQVLFAFLLTVPFTQRFHLVDGLARDAFFVAFLSTASATALLLAPVAYARIQFRQFDKERLVRLGTVTAIAGLALLAVALSASTFVVTQVLFSNVAAGAVAAGVAILFAGVWFVLPLVARFSSRPTAPPG